MIFKETGKKLIFPALIILIGMASTHCGDGARDAVETGNISEKGRIAVLLTDGETDKFSKIYVTIEGIALISDDRIVTVFSGNKRVDLLSLKDESRLVAIASSVPSRFYEKIRLHVSEIELVPKDGDAPVIRPKLPGNGKLDLVPGEPFFVRGGETLFVQLDLDAEKSIHIVETGNIQKYIFRPVVFIDILDREFEGKLVRLEGVVDEKNSDPALIRLCMVDMEPLLLSTHNADNEEPSDSSENICSNVHLLDDAAVFDQDGDPTGFDSVMEGDYVNIIGRFTDEKSADDDGDDNYDTHDYMNFEAEIIEIGERGAFLSIQGEIVSGYDESTGRFDFLIEEGQGFAPGTQIEARLYNDSKIYSSDGDRLDTSYIAENTSVRLEGIFTSFDAGPDLMKVAFAIVDLSAIENVVRIEGEISGMMIDDRTLYVDVADFVEVCVEVPEDVHIFQTSNQEEEGYLSRMISFEELSTGQELDIFGAGIAGCYKAEDIIITM